MLIYGKHPVVSVLKNKKRNPSKLFVTDNCLSFIEDKLGDDWESVSKKIQIQTTTPKKLDNILGGRSDLTHQGCALEVQQLAQPELTKVQEEAELLVVLDKVTDPHNIGAIIRSSAAFGADAVITDERNSPPENATILKTSAGCFEGISYIRIKSLVNNIKDLKKQGYKVVALDGYSEMNLKDYKRGQEKTLLIVGSEGEGVSPHIKRECDQLVKISINTGIESLNASVAASLALFHFSKI